MINQQQLTRLRKRDPYTAEIISQLIVSMNKLNNYHGIDTSGNVTAPPAIGSITVTATNGRFIVNIIDKSPISRGITYFVEYDTQASFLTAIQAALGPSRVFDKFLGSATYFWRAFSQYPLSLPSPKVYFGTVANPTGVAGGGAIAGPAQPTNQGSGTSSLPGQGYGNAPNQPPSQFPGFRGARGPNSF